MYSIMEECASIWYGTKDKKKAGLFSWWVNFFWRLFNWSLKTFCFFLEAWGLLGIFLAKKIPKRPKASRKNKMSSSFSWKYSKKSWLIMKISRLSFYLWSHIILTRILPWYYTFLTQPVSQPNSIYFPASNSKFQESITREYISTSEKKDNLKRTQKVF